MKPSSPSHPVTCLVNVLSPWTTWAAVNAALAEGRNWGWFRGREGADRSGRLTVIIQNYLVALLESGPKFTTDS